MNQAPDILSLNFPSYCNLCSMETTGCPAKMSKTAKHKMKQFGMHGYIISLSHFIAALMGPHPIESSHDDQVSFHYSNYIVALSHD